MEPYNLTYLIPSGTLTVSQTDRDIFDVDAKLKAELAEIPVGMVRLFKDLALSCSARRVAWELWVGRALKSGGEAILVASISALDLNFVNDLDFAVAGGNRLRMLCTSDATLANSTLHVRAHDFGLEEFAALLGQGFALADL